MEKILFTLTITLLVTHISRAGDSVDIDPVTVSPDLYHVLVENEHVRVVEYQIAPGQRDEWHTHPSKVSVVTSGGSLRITTADGKSFKVTEETGTASWMQPLGKHFAENIGTTWVGVVLVEVKSAAADSSRLPAPE